MLLLHFTVSLFASKHEAALTEHLVIVLREENLKSEEAPPADARRVIAILPRSQRRTHHESDSIAPLALRGRRECHRGGRLHLRRGGGDQRRLRDARRLQGRLRQPAAVPPARHAAPETHLGQGETPPQEVRVRRPQEQGPRRVLSQVRNDQDDDRGSHDLLRRASNRLGCTRLVS